MDLLYSIQVQYIILCLIIDSRYIDTAQYSIFLNVILFLIKAAVKPKFKPQKIKTFFDCVSPVYIIL